MSVWSKQIDGLDGKAPFSTLEWIRILFEELYGKAYGINNYYTSESHIYCDVTEIRRLTSRAVVGMRVNETPVCTFFIADMYADDWLIY